MSDAMPCSHWSDPMCVWAYVADPRVDHILDSFGDSLAISWRAVPVFGDIPARFDGGAWASGREARAASTASTAARFGFENVTGQVWIDDTPSSSWPACAAFASTALLEERGELPNGAANGYLRALRRTFFEDNRNIARTSVLDEVAESLGLPVGALQTMRADGTAWQLVARDVGERERLHVRGSPTWVFDGGREMLYGNVSEAIVRVTVQELLREAGFGCSHC